MEPVSERALVERCRRGQEGAFQELVGQYQGLVFGLLSRMLVRSAEVEALSQEVFLRVHRGLPYFRGEAPLRTWLLRIVANVGLEGPAADPAEAGRCESGSRLERALCRMAPGERFLLAADGMAGIVDDDLASALQQPVEVVRRQRAVAKRHLRHLLDVDHV